MALAGLKKQINKANQYVSEKMGATEGTRLVDEYSEMEKKTDGLVELVSELLNKTQEYLQPNPATRAKLMLSSRVTSAKAHAYPQPEGTLGETMIRSSKKIGEETTYSQSLTEMGEALKQLAEVKFALEDNVKQNFLEPLTHLQNKDIRDVLHHRKKLEGHRLDYDCKKRRSNIGGGANDMRQAEEKFEASFNLASMGMFNLLQNETEQISQLAAFAEALSEYHSQCANILESLTQRLMEQKQEAAQQPPEEYVSKKLHEVVIEEGLVAPGAPPGHYNGAASFFSLKSSMKPSSSNSSTNSLNATNSNTSNWSRPITTSASPLPSPVRSPARTPVSRGPCCQALYDFDAENPGEIGFKEGDIIVLNQKIDDNWLQGTVHGKTGMFPSSYVQVLVPLTEP
ncbi:Endophilin-A [Halotydeus destructor]|nr:Endophilin-A [Halotydeus destructor]